MMYPLTKSSKCPGCGSPPTHRSRKGGLSELILAKLFFISPFRCSVCDFRFFRFGLGSHTNDKPHQHPA